MKIGVLDSYTGGFRLNLLEGSILRSMFTGPELKLVVLPVDYLVIDIELVYVETLKLVELLLYHFLR